MLCFHLYCVGNGNDDITAEEHFEDSKFLFIPRTIQNYSRGPIRVRRSFSLKRKKAKKGFFLFALKRKNVFSFALFACKGNTHNQRILRKKGSDFFFSYYIQHCFIFRPSDSTVPTDAGIEPRTDATDALAVRYSNH